MTEEFMQYRVTITGCTESCKQNKIQAIKAFRTATNSGLKEAKDAVEATFDYNQTHNFVCGEAGINELRNAGFNIEITNPHATSIEAAAKKFMKTLVEVEAFEELKNFLNWYQLGGLTGASTTGRRLEP